MRERRSWELRVAEAAAVGEEIVVATRLCG